MYTPSLCWGIWSRSLIKTSGCKNRHVITEDIGMMINKILVVDDSPTDLANIRSIVADAGYAVLTATSGTEAVIMARKEIPDLIFMDIVMDGADGYDACREISQNSDTKNIPVIFITSKNQKADRVWAELQGGKAFITKPYTPEQILDQITALNQARLQA